MNRYAQQKLPCLVVDVEDTSAPGWKHVEDGPPIKLLTWSPSQAVPCVTWCEAWQLEPWDGPVPPKFAVLRLTERYGPTCAERERLRDGRREDLVDQLLGAGLSEYEARAIAHAEEGCR